MSYTLTPDDSLVIAYHMVSDSDTIANFTNHTYFNLDGQDGGNAMGQSVWIDADALLWPLMRYPSRLERSSRSRELRWISPS